jgi:hypothetical protein
VENQHQYTLDIDDMEDRILKINKQQLKTVRHIDLLTVAMKDRRELVRNLYLHRNENVMSQVVRDASFALEAMKESTYERLCNSNDEVRCAREIEQ